MNISSRAYPEISSFKLGGAFLLFLSGLATAAFAAYCEFALHLRFIPLVALLVCHLQLAVSALLIRPDLLRRKGLAARAVTSVLVLYAVFLIQVFGVISPEISRHLYFTTVLVCFVSAYGSSRRLLSIATFLSCCLPSERGEVLLGDLDEKYPVWKQRFGELHANLIYLCRVLSALWYEVMDHLYRLAEVAAKFRGVR